MAVLSSPSRHSIEPADEVVEESSNEFGPLPAVKPEPDWEIKFIHTPAQLERFAKKLEGVHDLPIDTETYRLHPKEPLNAHLRLIQVGIPEVENGKYTGDGTAYLIDAMRLREHGEEVAVKAQKTTNPFSPLKERFENPEAEVYAHQARFEQEQLAPIDIKPDLTDTLLLMRKLSPSLDKCQALAAATVEYLGHTRDKSDQASDWSITDLSPSQINYAALDVQDLKELRLHLEGLAERSSVDTSLEPEELIQLVLDSEKEKSQIIREIADELGVLEVRQARTKALAKAFLLRAAAEQETDELEYQSESCGSAYVKRPPIREVDFDKLFELVPQIAKEVVTQTTTQKALKEALEEHGVATKQANQLVKKYFPETGLTDPKLSLSIEPETIYHDDPGIEELRSSWSLHSVRTAEQAEMVTDSLSSAERVSLFCDGGDLQIGMIRGGEERGIAVSVPSHVLRELRENESPFYQALREKIDSGNAFSYGVKEASKLIAKVEETKPPAKKDEPIRDLEDEFKSYRPYLLGSSFQTATAEMLGAIAPPEHANAKHHLAHSLSKALDGLNERSAPPELDPSLPWEEQAAELLKSVLRDEASRVRMLRPRRDDWDVARVKQNNALEALLERLTADRPEGEKKYSVETGVGNAGISSSVKKELDSAQLRKDFPELADSVLELSLDKPELERRLAETSTAFRESMMERIYVEVEEGPPTAGFYPKYKAIYLGTSPDKL